MKKLTLIICLGIWIPSEAALLSRDPFAVPQLIEPKVEDVQIPTVRENAVRSVPAPWEVQLKATLLHGVFPMANVDGELLTIGSNYKGYKLVEITESSVVFEKNDQRRILALDR